MYVGACGFEIGGLALEIELTDIACVDPSLQQSHGLFAQLDRAAQDCQFIIRRADQEVGFGSIALQGQHQARKQRAFGREIGTRRLHGIAHPSEQVEFIAGCNTRA